MAQRDRKGVAKQCKCCMAPSGTDKRRFAKREVNKAARRLAKKDTRREENE